MTITDPTWRRAARFVARMATLLCAVALAVGVYATATALDPAEAAVIPGVALFTNASDTPLYEGDGSTIFELNLPEGSACTGDTAAEGYRVQSYMVPTTLDPDDLVFETDGLPGKDVLGIYEEFSQPLYDLDVSPYQNKATVNASVPDGPGTITPDIKFSFAWAVPGNIPAGTYNVGIACIEGVAGPLDKYWNVVIEVAVATPSEANPLGITFTVDQPRNTAVALAATPASPADVDDEVTITATVTPLPVPDTPIAVPGTVKFFDGSTEIGDDAVDVANGTASISISTLPPGVHPITAQFVPTDDQNFLPSASSVLSYTIAGEVPTEVELVVSPEDGQAVDQPVLLEARLTPTAAVGTVAFFDGTTELDDDPTEDDPIDVVSGKATLQVPGLAKGDHSLKAVFTPAVPPPGDPVSYGESTSAIVTYKIGAAVITTVELTASPVAGAAKDQAVTLTAEVTAGAVGAITFFDGTTAIESPVPVAADKAVKTTSTLPVGTRTLTAKFIPTDADDFTESTSSPLTYTISAGAAETTTLTLTATPGSKAPEGDDVKLTATITPAAAAGKVSFESDGFSLGTAVTVADGKATLTVDDLEVGEQTLRASFNPTDATKFKASSDDLEYTIEGGEPEETTVTLVVEPGTQATVGAEVTLKAVVSPAAAAGEITFKDGDTALGDPVSFTETVTTAPATYKTSALAAGTHVLKATYTPDDDDDFEESASNAVTLTVLADGTIAASGGALEFGGGGPTAVGTLPVTGGSFSLAVWALLMLVFGRAAVLLGRTPRLLPAEPQ